LELQQQLGYPLTSLFVLLDRETLITPLWGPDTIGYRTVNPYKIPDGPPSITVTLVDRDNSDLLDKQLSNLPVFEYVATEGKRNAVHTQ
jgi:hypothetical protein